MSQPSFIFVLTEDSNQQSLIRKYLRRIRYSRGVRYAKLPSGKGSGEQFVREKYPHEVASFRERNHRAKTALVVVIDADTESTDQRLRQLAISLTDAGLSPVGPDERILRLIPKRHIETWILCLKGDLVDEATDYKRLHHNQIGNQIEDAVEALVQWSAAPSLPDHCVPSLRSAMPEFIRLR